MRKMFLLISFVFLLSCVSAWSNTTFNNSLAAENLTFIGSEDITRYLSIPDDTTGITEAYLNLSGLEYKGYSNFYPGGGQCSAYTTIGNIAVLDIKRLANKINISNLHVKNLSFDLLDAGVSIGNVNYTIREVSTDNLVATCEIIDTTNDGTRTCDLGGVLLNGEYYVGVEAEVGNITSIRIDEPDSTSLGELWAFDNETSTWNYTSIPCVSESPDDILRYNLTFLESPLIPKNLTLKIGETWALNYTGGFSQINNKTINLFSIINQYLNSTYLIGSNYLIPFIFHSDSISVLEYSDINFSNEDFTNITISSTLCNDAVLHFSFKDEKNLSTISADIEYNFQYGLSNDTLRYIYGSLTGQDDFYVCVNGTESTNWLFKSGEIHYRSDNYEDRVFYLYDDTILTNGTLIEYDLYDLLTTSQTSFKIEVEDTSLNPYIDKFVSLLRWYPQLNEYKVVGMGKTDEKGEIVAHVEAEDVDYRIGVYERNGSLIKLEDPTRFVCLVNPCTYTLKISPTDTDFTSFFDVDYTFTYNTTTSIWSFVYSDSSQRTDTMNLTIYKVTGTSVYPICSDAATGYSGALSCNTSAYSGTFRGVVYRSASPDVPLAQKIVTTTATAFSSTFGLWLSLLIGIPIAFLFALMSPIAAVVGGVIMLLPALYFGAVNWAIVGGIAVLGGIVMHFLKRIG